MTLLSNSNMADFMKGNLTSLSIYLLIFLRFISAETSISYEQCTPSLNLGGLVFSDYTRRPVEHALHWSKAQSE